MDIDCPPDQLSPMVPQAEQLSESLRVHCVHRHWQPRQLPSHGPANEHQLLQELISCRDAGRADLSLELIDIADQHGWQSPWLNDNRARAELDLGRAEVARSIWHNLSQSNDSAVEAAASAMLRLLNQALELQAALMSCCCSAGWQPQFLGQPGAPGIGLGQALQEINLCREQGASQLSAELIQCCKAMDGLAPGWRTTSARLLVHIHRPQAIAIWQNCSPIGARCCCCSQASLKQPAGACLRSRTTSGNNGCP